MDKPSEKSQPSNKTLKAILDDMEPCKNVCYLQSYPDWNQGRSLFGGLVAAACIRAGKKEVEKEWKLMNMHLHFIDPVGLGESFLQTQLIRKGKSIAIVTVRLLQEDNIKTMVTLTFAKERISNIQVLPSNPPTINPPEKISALPYIKGVTPEFTQHLEYQFTDGQFPFSGSSSSYHSGWCRLKQERVCGEEMITALMDAWPSPVLQMLPSPSFASSVTWSMDFLLPKYEDCAENFWYYEAYTDYAKSGIAFAQAKLWSAKNELAAISRQSYSIYDIKQ
jgi:acyl-CoA thioesterase